MTTRECIVKRIYELCDQRNLTINGLAQISGIAPTSVKNIIYGTSKNPGVITLKKICDGLGITLMEFFDTEDFRSLEQEIE